MRTSSWILAVVLAGSGCNSERSRQGAQAQPQPPPPRAAPIVDARVAATCVVTYECSLSHPGLGSNGTSSTVDLAACTRARTTYSRPYHDRPDPPPPPRPPSASAAAPADAAIAPERLDSSTCAQIAALLGSITRDEERAAQEAAQVDTTACTLTATCPGTAAPALRIQRQTATGPTGVEQLIRAIR